MKVKYCFENEFIIVKMILRINRRMFGMSLIGDGTMRKKEREYY